MDKILRYWDAFYEGRRGNPEPTGFARFVERRFPDHTTLVDVGCGDGRDTLWFASRGWSVIGLDASNATLVDCARRGAAFGERCRFSRSEIGRDSIDAALRGHAIDLRKTLVYARFLLHAITDAEERWFLDDVSSLVARGARLCVEARTVEDAALPKVEAPHYRRFIEPRTLEERCRSLEMEIEFVQCGKGLAAYKSEDPAVVRMICRGSGDV